MEKYYKASEVNAIIEKLMNEPGYQHEYENFFCGVSAVADRLPGVSTITLPDTQDLKGLDIRRNK